MNHDNLLMHRQLDMSAIAMKLVLCMLMLMQWLQVPSGVRGTGGAMGPVVSLVDSISGNLTTVCALQSGTLLPVCMGALLAGTPKTQAMWALTAGEAFVCGLKYESHSPICWGSGASVTSVPFNYASTSYSTINAGRAHVCAVRDNSTVSPGTVDCWGENTFGQSLPPKNVPMVSVTSGEYYSCGITLATKMVVCWGNTSSMDMPSPPSNGQFKAIFSARVSMCGIRLHGYTECWSGQSSLFANPYPDLLFTSMAGVFFYTCAVVQPNHQMICWSVKDVAPAPMPYAITFLSASASIDAVASNDTAVIKDGYICGVREDIEAGNLFCVGISPHSLVNSLSSFTASKGICRDRCPEGQYPVLNDGQCPNPDHKVCLDCLGQCPVEQPPPSIPPSKNISTTPPPSTRDSNSSSPSTMVSSRTSISKLVVPISIAVVCLVIVASLIAFLIVWYYHGICSQVTLNDANGLILFTRQQIRIATDNYRNEIGNGGYGKVYRGILPDNQMVAVKIPHTPGGGGDYRAEFDILRKLNHPSLVKFLGYCEQNNALVLSFMENGSLLDRIRDQMSRRRLSSTRQQLDIALQVAKGLKYINQKGVIHRDVKPANILLDASWNAYITDFGVSRFRPDGDKSQCSTRVIGTAGYLDPEYQSTGLLTTRSDVYSFGVVVLELTSGLPCTGLPAYASSLYAEGRLSEMVDRNLLKLHRDCRLDMLKIAISCVEASRANRPTMEEVVIQLEQVRHKI